MSTEKKTLKHLLMVIVFAMISICGYSQETVIGICEHTIESTNKSDICESFSKDALGFEEQYSVYGKNYDSQLQYDIDKDGFKESFLILVATDYSILYIHAAKENDKGDKVTDSFTVDLDREHIDWSDYGCFSVMLHDFDNDGVNEVILTYERDTDVCGNVFKLNGVGVDPKQGKGLRNWFEVVGSFKSSWSRPQVDGANILTRYTYVGGKNEITHVYVNSSLKELMAK